MKKLFLAMILCLCALSLWAVPAERVALQVLQPDGTILTLYQRGDEYFHYLETEDGVVVTSDGRGYYYAEIIDGKIIPSSHLAHSPMMRTEDEAHVVGGLPKVQQFCEALQRERRAQRMCVTRGTQRASEISANGEVKVPVILVQYADVKFSFDDPKATFEAHINGDDYTAAGGYGSVREYFEDQSEGQFSPKFEIIGPVTLSEDAAYYGGNDEEGYDLRPREMVQEACRIANSQIDFSEFDNNGDGYVDIVYIIYAGYGEASNTALLENTIWPHQWALEIALPLDGVRISRYACNNELDGYQGTVLDGIGTFCHEFSHCLGLPDFYPTDDSNGSGMGWWSLMHYGCYCNNGHTPCGYTGYEKEFLGWKPLIVLNNPADVVMEALSEGGDAYKIVNDANPDEYYVLENRRKTKWDMHLPAEGMLVTHVDYLESAWQNNIVNNDPMHQRMTIIPADNKLTDNSVEGDTYPGVAGNTALTDTSTPAAKVYVGGAMGKSITDIAIDDNGRVCFSFMKGELPSPQKVEVVEVGNDALSMAWSTVDGATGYEVLLERLQDNGNMRIHSAYTQENSYRFENLDRGVYRCAVRSMCNDAYSRYTYTSEVALSGNMLPQVEVVPRIYIDKDSIYIEAADSIILYYTTDGSSPTSYSARYDKPFLLGTKMKVRAVAYQEGYSHSEIVEKDNWFKSANATYRIISEKSPQVALTDAVGGNAGNDYVGHCVAQNAVVHDSLRYVLVGIDKGAFRNASSLRSVTVCGDSLRFVGDSLFFGCSSLNAVVWNVGMPLGAEMFDTLGYSNLLVYVSDGSAFSHPLIDTGRMTLVVDGKASSLCLEADKPFYCPCPFIADEVTLQRRFTQTTGLGKVAGWETIVLPFDVQKFTHQEKGDVAPFGNDHEQSFWLAELDKKGFVLAKSLRANTPYIIAMPNHTEYGDNSLDGIINFSAAQALIYATDELSVTENAAMQFVPTYEALSSQENVYVLNVGTQYEGFDAGSVFVPNKYVATPFTAYMTPVAGASATPLYRVQMCADVEEVPNEFIVAVREGVVYLSTPKACDVVVFDLAGRKVCSIACEAGVNEITGLHEGVYLIEKTKVCVTR